MSYLPGEARIYGGWVGSVDARCCAEARSNAKWRLATRQITVNVESNDRTCTQFWPLNLLSVFF